MTKYKILDSKNNLIGFERIGVHGQWEYKRANRKDWSLGVMTDGQDWDKFQRFQFTGIKDRNDNEIYFGDTLIFANKWEWYRGEYQHKILLGSMTKEAADKEIEARPYEERKVKSIQDYKWLLSSEVQQYFEIKETEH